MPDPALIDDEDGQAFLYWPPEGLDSDAAGKLMVQLAADVWGMAIKVTSTPRRWWYRDPEHDEDEEAVFPVDRADQRAKVAWIAEYEEDLSCENCGQETQGLKWCSRACQLQLEHAREVAERSAGLTEDGGVA